MNLAPEQSPINHTPALSTLERIRNQIDNERSNTRRLALTTRSREHARAMNAKITRLEMDGNALEVLFSEPLTGITSVRTMILQDRMGFGMKLFLAAFVDLRPVAAVTDSRFLTIPADQANDWVQAFDCTSNTLAYDGTVL